VVVRADAKKRRARSAAILDRTEGRSRILRSGLWSTAFRARSRTFTFLFYHVVTPISVFVIEGTEREFGQK